MVALEWICELEGIETIAKAIWNAAIEVVNSQKHLTKLVKNNTCGVRKVN